MYIAASVVHSRDGWKLRVAECSHLRSVPFDAVEHLCWRTDHRLICRYRWGIGLLNWLSQDRHLLSIPLTREQAWEIEPECVTTWETIFAEDCG